MKILLSWSSGKDSAWALHVLNLQYPGAVQALLTTVNEAVDRVAMHAVRRDVLEAQARAAGLPLIVVPIPHPCPNEIYEERMRAAVAAASRPDSPTSRSAICFSRTCAAIESIGSPARVSSRCSRSGAFRPTRSPSEMVATGLRARLACVDTRVLDASFVGREFDRSLLDDLPAGIDPCGENGEFHTCVYAGPMFKEPLVLEPGEVVTREPFVWRDLQLVAEPATWGQTWGQTPVTTDSTSG